MKPSAQSVSPFIILLIPVILVIVLTFTNIKTGVDPEKFEAAAYFKMPSLKSVIFTLF